MLYPLCCSDACTTLTAGSIHLGAVGFLLCSFLQPCSGTKRAIIRPRGSKTASHLHPPPPPPPPPPHEHNHRTRSQTYIRTNMQRHKHQSYTPWPLKLTLIFCRLLSAPRSRRHFFLFTPSSSPLDLLRSRPLKSWKEKTTNRLGWCHLCRVIHLNPNDGTIMRLVLSDLLVIVALWW